MTKASEKFSIVSIRRVVLCDPRIFRHLTHNLLLGYVLWVWVPEVTRSSDVEILTTDLGAAL